MIGKTLSHYKVLEKLALRKRAIAWSVAAVTTVVAISIAFWSSTEPVSRPSAQFLVTPPPGQSLAFANDPNVAISPDGSRIVYGGEHDSTRQLYVRPIDQLEATPIPGTESAHSPFFSPDSQWVGFFSDVDRTLRTVSLTDGSSMTVCYVPEGHFGASWGEDNTIVFSSIGFSLAQVPAWGGTPAVLTNPDAEKGELRHGFPVILPGGKAVLFTIVTGPDLATRTAVLSLETGERKILFEGGIGAHYAPTGHLVYGQAGTLWAVPFDLAQLEIVGSPAPILEGVMTTPDGPSIFTFSRDGSLAYVSDVSGTGEALHQENQINVVLNWFEELKRLAPADN